MKHLMIAHHYGWFHMPHTMVWMHAKHIDMVLLLAGVIMLLIVGMTQLISRNAMIPASPFGAYPGGFAYP